MFAIAWLVRDLYKDTQLSDVVVEYAKKIIEKRKTKQEITITEEKERTDKDTVAIANPKNRAYDGHICKSKGEVEAAENLAKAANIMASTDGALHLRTLSTINDVSSDQSNTIIFALPIEVLRALEKKSK